ncbi:MAG TPA: hypothetical protein VMU80_20935 [Bryobacteraceae bacterium]|nr:hypothetical protein [Bryobacteraceae bacterium]
MAVFADPENGGSQVDGHLAGKKKEEAKGAQRNGEEADILRGPIARLRDYEVSDLQRLQRLWEAAVRAFGGEKGTDQRQINAERIIGEPAILTQVILVLLKEGGREGLRRSRVRKLETGICA